MTITLHTLESEGGCSTLVTCAASYHGSTGPFNMAIDAAQRSLPDATTSVCLFLTVRHQKRFLPSSLIYLSSSQNSHQSFQILVLSSSFTVILNSILILLIVKFLFYVLF